MIGNDKETIATLRTKGDRAMIGNDKATIATLRTEGDRAVLEAEIHEVGFYEGDSKIGIVEGWAPNLEEWQAMWAETDPIGPWDPSSSWLYR